MAYSKNFVLSALTFHILCSALTDWCSGLLDECYPETVEFLKGGEKTACADAATLDRSPSFVMQLDCSSVEVNCVCLLSQLTDRTREQGKSSESEIETESECTKQVRVRVSLVS